MSGCDTTTQARFNCLKRVVIFGVAVSVLVAAMLLLFGSDTVWLQENDDDLRTRVVHLEDNMADVKMTVDDLAQKLLRGNRGEVQKRATKVPTALQTYSKVDAATVSPSAFETKANADVATTLSPTMPIIHDFTSCENVQKESIKKEIVKVGDSYRDYRFVRLGVTNPCFNEYSDMMVFFMWSHGEDGDAKVLCQENDKKTAQVAYWANKMNDMDMPADLFMVMAQMTGCFGDGSRNVYRFYAARMMGLETEKSYTFYLQNDKEPKQDSFRKFMSAPIAGSHHATEIMIVGDTDLPGAELIMSHLASDVGWNDLVIHVGDLTYGSNTGECYGHKFDRGAKDPCGWDCIGLDCSAATRMNGAVVDKVLAWCDAYSRTVKGRMPWMSTMGNHDNDAFWFFTIRPTVMGAMPGVHPSDLAFDSKKSLGTIVNQPMSQSEVMMFAMERMKDPFFYSFDYGLVHVISLGTEDNPFDPYEAWDGEPVDDDLTKRFAQHYGRESRQYQWIIKDLTDAVARRDEVPWIVVFTHRPMYHTAQHHAWCSVDGDWYGCLFRDTYEPLYKRFGVDIVLSGHSHHYSRSHLMYNGKVDLEKGTIHATIGVGGFETTGETWSGNPDWVAYRQGTTSGFVKFRVENDTHAKWIHYSPAAGSNEVNILDETWIKRRNG